MCRLASQRAPLPKSLNQLERRSFISGRRPQRNGHNVIHTSIPCKLPKRDLTLTQNDFILQGGKKQTCED